MLWPVRLALSLGRGVFNQKCDRNTLPLKLTPYSELIQIPSFVSLPKLV